MILMQLNNITINYSNVFIMLSCYRLVFKKNCILQNTYHFEILVNVICTNVFHETSKTFV